MKPKSMLSRRSLFFSVFLAVLMASTTSLLLSSKAQAGVSPVKPAYSHIEDAAFVAEYAVIPPRKDVLIIDARPPKEYERGHIVPAVNIPHRKFDESIHLLPEDKSVLLIYYCGGLKCH